MGDGFQSVYLSEAPGLMAKLLVAAAGFSLVDHLDELTVDVGYDGVIEKLDDDVETAIQNDSQIDDTEKLSLSNARQEAGRWFNNRAENSHQPFRRREHAMAKSRSVKSLQNFLSAHASIHNHFNQECHLYNR